jgi:uncharacterized protein
MIAAHAEHVDCQFAGRTVTGDLRADRGIAVRRLSDLRRLAVSRSLFPLTTLDDAVRRLGFVQADPIRAPARAQDLTLRHRVNGYRAGDLDRRYSRLDLEEDTFINYGYLPRSVQALMHPRNARALSPAPRNQRERELLTFIRQRGEVHPGDVGSYFLHGVVTNYWGGSSRATTHLLESMQYRGLIRVARRDRGIRIYAVREHVPARADAAARRARIDALVDVLVRTYAPLPRASLSATIGRLRYAVPQWRCELKAAVQRALERLAHARVAEVDWYWPAGEHLPPDTPDHSVRVLTPFDPVVWDRRRFELLWGWSYRFEAYTPGPARKLGYYALPVLWRDDVIGWANLTVKDGELRSELGYVRPEPPRDRGFARALAAELDRMRAFLGIGSIHARFGSPARDER